MAERRHPGRAAAPGLAEGPLVRLIPAAAGPAAPQGSPAEEAARLQAALARAGADLAALAAAHGGDGAAILEFQIEMLADPALVEEADAAIAAGRAAGDAWQAALDEQIAGFAAAEDDYFRARASDLADLQDRVLRLLSARALQDTPLPAGAILLDHDLTPSRFLALDWTRLGGAALLAGSAASHVAMLARARGVPLLTGLGAVPDSGASAILDAEDGVLILDPASATSAAYAARRQAAAARADAAAAARDRPAATAMGEPVAVMLNIDDPAAVDDATLLASDGVGLLRTEFLLSGRDRLPDEAEQHAAYVALLDRLAGRPCIIRTFDIGGDKPHPGLDLAPEANPFLGLRGLRLCLERPALFRPQIRALLRAAPGRPLQVMLPMVATAAELAEARARFAAELAELQAAGVPAALPPLGIMVETPAAALTLDLLDAAFYSIGSNDLIQYVMAAARDAGGRVGALNDPLQPAVLRLIGQIVAQAAASGRDLSLCGEMAADPRALPALLDLGLRKLSVAPAALGAVKLQIAAHGAAPLAGTAVPGDPAPVAPGR
jgi:phosphotransferase system enzyme I (PtsI)